MTSKRARLRVRLFSYWSLINVYFVLAAAKAVAKPTSPLCDSGTYRNAHPLICDTGGAAPGSFPGGGGGSGRGGLLGLVGDVVGGLTGGLL